MNTTTVFSARTVYKDKDAILEHVNEWAKNNKVLLSARSSSASQLILECIHGQSSNCNRVNHTKRFVTHSYHTGCEFRLSFGYSSKVGHWRFSTGTFHHKGHQVSDKVFGLYSRNNRLTENEIAHLRSLTNTMYVRPNVLAELAEKATGKVVSSKQISNLQINSNAVDLDKALTEYLNDLEGTFLAIFLL